MLFRMIGGVHPPENKDATESLPIEEISPPEVLVIPLSQHIGAPASACVSAGDRVDKGGRIGEPGGFVSVPIHASVSGRVTAIEPRPGPLGKAVLSVVLENDGEERWAEGLNASRPTEGLDAAAIRRIAHDAGLVGMGGATFPTHVKLSPPDNKPVDTIIINGAECEPYLTADHALMLEEPNHIASGADLVRRAVGATTVIFAVEENKPDAFEAIRKAAAEIRDARAVILPTRYPQGAEKQLIQVITGRQVPSGGLPMDVGLLVQNVGTCAALYEAARYNRPLLERVTTVTGPCAGKPGNFRIRVGTLMADVLKRVGFSRPPKRLVMGGPMMGIAQRCLDIPVTKGTSGIVLLDEAPDEGFRACIRCGKCVRACPVAIVPSELSVLLEADRVDDAAAVDMLDCIECGCCTYVCPAKRPIVNWIKIGKAELAERRARERKAAK